VALVGSLAGHAVITEGDDMLTKSGVGARIFEKPEISGQLQQFVKNGK
jgi:hypothetical protein